MEQSIILTRFSGLRQKLFTLLCILIISTAANAQKFFVRGTVSDNNGSPLAGAYVTIKGTNVGVSTDANGNYTIEFNSGKVLVFSFLGMKNHEEDVNSRSIINVVMHQDNTQIDEIVVVGYGTKSKSSLTGSVSAIRGEELIKAPSTNVSSLLGGRITGIASVQQSGQPGLDQASLSIRGSRYDVAYIVDGMPRSISDIDPSNIESISVLKDAAASSVYGLKSAGGVIIVTTKRGFEGENTINYTGSYGLSQNANFSEFLDGPQYAYYYNKGLEMDGFTPIFTKDMVQMMNNNDDSDGWSNTNWVKKIFGTGYNQKHNLAAQGGNEKIRYYASLGYLSQQGNIKSYTYERYNLRTNIDAKIAKNLKLSLGLAGQVGSRKSPGFSAGGGEGGGRESQWMSVARQTIAALPFLPEIYNDLPVASPNKYGQGSSPVAAIDKSGYNKQKSLDLQTTVSLEYTVPWVKGLSLKASGSYDHGYFTNKIISTPYYVMLASLPSASSSKISYSKVLDVRNTSYNTIGEGLYRETQMVGNASINYDRTFCENHHMDAMVLGEIRDFHNNRFASYGKNLPFVELPELGFAQPADSPISGGSDASRSVGYVGRLRYDYANKYLLELSGRYDGSYKFNGNVGGKRWGFFPAASVGWRISEEDFMKDCSWVDNLKLRLSAGETGNDDVKPYKFLNTYKFVDSGNNIRPLYLKGLRYNTLFTASVANPYLTWERVRSYNAGIDASLWSGLLGVEADIFYNYNYDILLSMGGNVPESVGRYYMDVENYGQMDAKGVELNVTHKNKIGTGKDAVMYNIGFNFTYAYSRWLRFPDSPNDPDYQKLTGKEYGSMLGWKSDGLYKSEEEIDASPWPFGQRPRIGDIKYVDVNGDGVVEYQDKVFTGRTNRPKIQAGLNIGFSWKGFDLSLLFTGAAMFDISLTGTYYNGYDDNTIFTETFKEGGNSPKWLVEGAWTPENTNAKYPRLTVSSPTNNNGLACTFWFRDGKYIRMKTAQVGYNLPKKALDMFSMKGMRIFFEGSNLFTISGLPKGVDPESPGVNNGYYPQQRTLMGGLSITF